MIGRMVAMLLADRSRWEQLVADPSLARTAVEEVLRFDANPGFGMPHYLTRTPNHHLSFGAGPHSCLGQALARTELTTVLEVLLRRLPTLELAIAPDELRRIEGLAVGGVEELPVRW